MNILILEDEPAVADLLKAVVKNEMPDWNVYVAHDYGDVYKLNSDIKYDAIIADIYITPGPNGERGDSFAKWYQQNNPNCKIALITGRDDYKDAYCPAGMRLFRKPLNIYALTGYLIGGDMSDESRCKLHEFKMMEIEKKLDHQVEITEAMQSVSSETKMVVDKIWCCLVGTIDSDGKPTGGLVAKVDKHEKWMRPLIGASITVAGSIIILILTVALKGI